MSGYTRNRWLIIGLGFAVVALGLASRRYVGWFPRIVGNYPGDALWALAAYLSIAFIVPRIPVWKLAVVALGVSYAVEFSQLLQVPWANEVRSTLVGHLLLGQGFDWIDLVALSMGIGLGASVDAICAWKARRAASDELLRRSE